MLRGRNEVTKAIPTRSAIASIIRDPAATQAIQYAVDEGCLLVEGDNSVCLTDSIQLLAKD